MSALLEDVDAQFPVTTTDKESDEDDNSSISFDGVDGALWETFQGEWESASARKSRVQASNITSVWDSFAESEVEDKPKRTLFEDQPKLTQKKTNARFLGYPVNSYGVILTLFFAITTFLWVLDRFTANVWPRQIHTLPDGSPAGYDHKGMDIYPWTVLVFEISVRFTGRFLTCALNVAMFTLTRQFHHWLLETRVATRGYIDFSQEYEWRIWLHRIAGWGIGMTVMIHVYVILLAPIFNKFELSIADTKFSSPLSESFAMNISNFTHNNISTQTTYIRYNDVARIIVTTISFVWLAPRSIYLINSNYRVCILLPKHYQSI
eukprot:m.40222 g.40222  ORF g.40222 m.40222 type:complete len:321 (-) comp9637_c0_seq2:1572-2534(-)